MTDFRPSTRRRRRARDQIRVRLHARVELRDRLHEESEFHYKCSVLYVHGNYDEIFYTSSDNSMQFSSHLIHVK